MAERAPQELREALEVFWVVKPVPLVVKVTLPLALFGSSQHVVSIVPIGAARCSEMI